MGKAYANKKKKADRPENDFYPTPKYLTKCLIETGEISDGNKVLEPCCGGYAISNVLTENGYDVVSRDIIYGNDFLVDDYSKEEYDYIITNPPFELWDEIINKAKTVKCKKVIAIGRTNYFASHSRNKSNIWNGLSDVYIFDRQVAYDKPLRDDGLFYCGCLVTGWFIWSVGYTDTPRLHILDIDKYAYRTKKSGEYSK